MCRLGPLACLSAARVRVGWELAGFRSRPSCSHCSMSLAPVFVGHLFPLMCGLASHASRPGLLQPLVPGLQGPGRHPPQGLHLKGISWDHQKPAALITGILFLVSFAEFLQVFLVISQDPGRLVTVPPLCPQPCFLGTWPLGTTQIKNGESRLASGGTVYGQDV